MAPIRLMVFPGAFNWPIWVAQDRDLFAENGVSVQVQETPGSVVQWTSLAKGHSDLAITLMDNVVAYREGQGEAPVTVPDAIAVMASDATVMPTLVTRPDIKSYADLKGQTLSVDAVLT
ncbi:MAG: ABC transporter substrate-binding protein, partial [Pseudolabrys sp.]